MMTGSTRSFCEPFAGALLEQFKTLLHSLGVLVLWDWSSSGDYSRSRHQKHSDESCRRCAHVELDERQRRILAFFYSFTFNPQLMRGSLTSLPPPSSALMLLSCLPMSLFRLRASSKLSSPFSHRPVFVLLHYSKLENC